MRSVAKTLDEQFIEVGCYLPIVGSHPGSAVYLALIKAVSANEKEKLLQTAGPNPSFDIWTESSFGSAKMLIHGRIDSSLYSVSLFLA
jgi:hypothetical protein